MTNLPKISDTEWQVMKILWESSPLTANEVVDKLAGMTSWKPKTVKTLLNRLVGKRAIGFEKDNRSYCYYPLVREEECIREENRTFLQKVYSGSLNIMFASFLEENELSENDIRELKELLERKGKGR